MRISLRPSAASTWLYCSESPWFVAEHQHLIPKDSSDKFSDEGDYAHKKAEGLLKTGEAVFDTPYNNEAMKRHLFEYRDLIHGKTFPGDTALVEPEVPLWYMKERIGKVDSLIFGTTRNVIDITDLKYGEGVAVYARENDQLAIYGRSACELLIEWGLMDIKPDTLIRLTIFQPRCSHGEKLSEWELLWSELVEYTDVIGNKAEAIIARRGCAFNPGKTQCRWCDGSTFCPARNEQLYGVNGLDMLEGLGTPDGSLKPPSAFSPLRLGQILKLKDQITAQLGALETYAKKMVAERSPNAPKGWKLVDAKAGNRKWRDPDAVSTLLEDYLPSDVLWTDPKLISPAQAEKELTAEQRKELKPFWADLTVRGEGGVTLVEEDDERDPVTSDPAKDFQNEEDGPDSLAGLDML